MEWALALLLAFLLSASQVSCNLEGRIKSIFRKTGSTVEISCDIKEGARYIHWYFFPEHMVPRRLLYYDTSSSSKYLDSETKADKYDGSKITDKSFKLHLKHLEASDSGVYYCAVWGQRTSIKTFSDATKLTVIPPDLDGAVSPKPTIFLPSIAETNLQKAGTHLCLLENFFPGDIKVYWKEKNGNKILESQQGDTMKTGITYTKLSWLTVPETSLDKEHLCVIKHESNKGGADQEILFPPVKKVVTDIPCLKDGKDALWLQLTNTSAYYTYLLLFLKSMVYFGIIAFSLVRRTTVCSSGKRS
uniref:Ig-like domain-containing protein n=1 Tax=Microcebus murinus TaxID=30608 RepID=A0A8C5VDG4_MICMU